MTNVGGTDTTNAGRRVELVHTYDPGTTLRSGDQGTYDYAIGFTMGERREVQHNIRWDNCSELVLLDDEDNFRFIKP
jgi:hypothetical protein